MDKKTVSLLAGLAAGATLGIVLATAASSDTGVDKVEDDNINGHQNNGKKVHKKEPNPLDN